MSNYVIINLIFPSRFTYWWALLGSLVSLLFMATFCTTEYKLYNGKVCAFYTEAGQEVRKRDRAQVLAWLWHCDCFLPFFLTWWLFTLTWPFKSDLKHRTVCFSAATAFACISFANMKTEHHSLLSQHEAL